MDSRWQQIEVVLEALLQAPPDEHVALLDRLCAGEAELRHEVEALMDAHRSAGAFLETSASAFAAPYVARLEGTAPDRTRQIVGRYRLLREIGRGGMGAVYLAERADGQFEQEVALKLIKPGMDSDEILRRFLRERQILARLQHPHIARLLDGGLSEDDHPYFVMEYVEGRPATEYCEAQRLDVDERLRLFEQVCRTVQYAHQNLVVHRDLKPSNVLVTEDGVVKLLDFGIARMLGEEDDAPGLTQGRQWLMTPAYASPEQVRGEAVTTASDIYQLGLLLYELLTGGGRPYRFEGRSPTEVERVVCEQEPVRPSLAVVQATPKAGESGSPERRRLRGDLDAIVLKALRKEPERRYTSAEALAEDMRRHRAGQPVSARGEGLAYRAGTFLRRHRVGTAATAFVLLLSLGFGLFYTLRMKQERDRARLEAIKAVQSAELFQQFFENWDPDAADRGKVRARDLLQVTTARAEREWQHQPDVQATLFSLLGGLYTNMGDLPQADSLLARALALQERLHGSVHQDLAATLRRKGQLLYLRGDYDAAEQAYRRALAMFEALFGAEYPETLRTRQGLATVLLHGQERFVEAEILFREILTLHQAARADTSLVGADATRGLGLTLFYQGRNEEAAAILRPALDEHLRLYGELHPVTVLTMQALSANLRDLGRVDEAVAIQENVLRIHRQLYGEAHPSTVFARYVLAFNLHRKGDFEAAHQLSKEVVAQTIEEHGEYHPLTGRYVRFHGYVSLDWGEPAAAEPLLRRALTIYRNAYSYQHADEAGLLNRLAFVLLQRRARDAEAIYKEALALHRERGEEPVFVTYGLHFLAWAMQQMGERDEAEQLYQEAQALYQKQLPVEHPYLKAVHAGLGQVQLEGGDMAAAPADRPSLARIATKKDLH